MKARITDATQFIDRSSDDPVRRVLMPGTVVVDKGEEKKPTVAKGKDGAPDEIDYRTGVVKVPVQDIFKLIDAAKAKPSTRADLDVYRRRGRPATTVDEE